MERAKEKMKGGGKEGLVGRNRGIRQRKRKEERNGRERDMWKGTEEEDEDGSRRREGRNMRK